MIWTPSLESSARRCAVRLQTAARLALIEMSGPEPESAAEYLVLAVESIAKDLARLQRVVSDHNE